MKKLALFGGARTIVNKLTPYNSIQNEELEAAIRVVRSGRLSSFIGAWCDDFYGGLEVRKFEEEWALKFKCKHAISMNSNTSGLIAALGAIGLSPGDEVIVPPYSMSATVMAPLFYGGIPVFVDIEPDTFCLDPKLVKAEISSKTKAILAVNMFGHPAQLKQLRAIAEEHKLFLIEDNAQAPLASEGENYAGTVGHIGIFSLNYHKHIHTGEGGVCCTDDDNLSQRLMMIRNHGENIVEPLSINDITNLIGFNFRMTEIAAAIGREQLRKINHCVDERQLIAEKLSLELGSIKGLKVPLVRDKCRHVYYVWCARHDSTFTKVNRTKIVKALVAEGLPVSEGYVKPLYMLPVFQRKIAIGANGWPFNLTNRTYYKGMCPVAERMDEYELIEFPICSFQMNNQELELVIQAFHKVYSQLPQLEN